MRPLPGTPSSARQLPAVPKLLGPSPCLHHLQARVTPFQPHPGAAPRLSPSNPHTASEPLAFAALGVADSQEAPWQRGAGVAGRFRLQPRPQPGPAPRSSPTAPG